MDVGLNTAQIIDRARAKGVNLSDAQAQQILSQAWNQSIYGADPGKVDALIGGGGASAPSNPIADAINAINESVNKRTDEYNKKVKDFDQANPFNYDEVLAEERSGAEQRLDPYYNQTLSDYLTGVETKRSRSLEDERTLLSELQGDTDFYSGRARVALDNALERSRSGFANAGLYSSGQQLRSEGQQREESGANLGDFLRQQGERENRITTAGDRLREQDLPLEEGLYRRDLGAQRESTLKNETLSGFQNRFNRRLFEQEQFSGAAPPGVNPQTYSSTLYSFLR